MDVMEIQKLEKNSSSAQINAAMTACIADKVRQGIDPDEARQMCDDIIREKTDKSEV